MNPLVALFVDKAYAANPVLLQLPSLGLQTDTNAADLANRIVNFLGYLVYPLAFIALVYSAYLLISSNGKPEAYAAAKRNVIFILTGVFLIVFAAIFVNFVRAFFHQFY